MAVRVLAVVVLVVVVLLLFSGGLKQMPILQTVTAGPQHSGASQLPPGRAKIQSTANPKRLNNVMSRRKAEPALVALPAVPIQTVVIEVETPPVPKEADLRPAMPRAELIRKFGEPDAIAAWTDDGTLYEKLTYLDAHTYTELLFRDGGFVSSHTERH